MFSGLSQSSCTLFERVIDFDSPSFTVKGAGIPEVKIVGGDLQVGEPVPDNSTVSGDFGSLLSRFNSPVTSLKLTCLKVTAIIFALPGTTVKVVSLTVNSG